MWWTLIAVKSSRSYSDQQYIVLCLILESFHAPVLHQLHGQLHKGNSYLARLTNTAWMGVLVIGVQVVNSPFWSLGWIWGSESVRTWRMGKKVSVCYDPAGCSVAIGPSARPIGGCPLAGGLLPGRGSGLTSPAAAPATCPGEPCGPVPSVGLQPSPRLPEQGDERHGLP